MITIPLKEFHKLIFREGLYERVKLNRDLINAMHPLDSIELNKFFHVETVETFIGPEFILWDIDAWKQSEQRKALEYQARLQTQADQLRQEQSEQKLLAHCQAKSKTEQQILLGFLRSGKLTLEELMSLP